MHRFILAFLFVLMCSTHAEDHAMVFEGEKPHVELGSESTFDVTDAVSIEAWVRLAQRPTQAPKWESIVTKGASAWALTRYSNHQRLTFRTFNGLEINDLVCPVELQNETWYHVAVVFDGESKQFYLNGELTISRPYTGPIATNNFKVLIGATDGVAGRGFNGQMDTVRIWNIARSAEAIAASLHRETMGTEAGLLGEWRFNEAAANTLVADSSASSIDGTVMDNTANPLRVAGVTHGVPMAQNWALAFDGTNEYVELPFESHFDLTTRISVEAWVYPESLGPAALVSKGAWKLGLDASGKVTFTTDTTAPLVSGTALVLDAWSHVAASYDGARRVIHINGVPDADDSKTTAIDTNDDPVRFGANPNGSEHFTGMLDDVRIWGNARTALQIAQYQDHQLNGNELHLRGNWRFDTVSGTVAVDSRTIPPPGNDVLLDFEVHGTNDGQLHDLGNIVIEDGFTLTAVSGTLLNPGHDHPAHNNSATIQASDAFGVVELTRQVNQPFQVLSVTLSRYNVDEAAAALPIDLTFSASALDRQVQQTVTLRPGMQGQQEFILSGLAAIDTLRWQRSSLIEVDNVFVQIDNIVIRTGPFAGVDTSAHGVLHNMSDSNRRPAHLVAAAPIPGQYALQFDGVDDHLVVNHSLALNHASFTLEAWVYAARDGVRQTILRKGDTGYGLSLEADLSLLYWRDVVSTPLKSDRALTLNAWHHVAVVVDQVRNSTIFFIDGHPAGEFDVATAENNDDPLTIACTGSIASGSFFQGALDEIRLWKSPRSAQEIAFFASRPLPAGDPMIVAHWAMNDGVGILASDGVHDTLLDAVFHPTDGPTWIEGPGPPYRDGQYSLQYDGIDDFLRVTHHSDLDFSDDRALTIEAWINPSAGVRPADDYRTITIKGDSEDRAPPQIDVAGYGLALDSAGHLCYWSGPGIVHKSTGIVANDSWQHVAVTVVVDAGTPANSVVTFYINGVQNFQYTGADVIIADNSLDLFIARQGAATNTARNYYRGYLDELRLWNVARTPTEIAKSARSQIFFTPPAPTGLVAYWSFNEGYREASADEQTDNAVLGSAIVDPRTAYDKLVNREATMGSGMELAAWSEGLYQLEWDGEFWDVSPIDPAMNLAKTTTSAGLWVGTVTLTHVSEVATARPGSTGDLTPTADTASFPITLHVDAEGYVRLLKRVTLMQRESAALAPGDESIVLVTDYRLIPEFRGLVMRGGKLVGRRIGTVGYDFPENELEMTGGLGGGRSLLGEILLPAAHPTNPFRHRYHPDHRNDASGAYVINRQLQIHFHPPEDGPGQAGGYGVDRIAGDFQETITGLHKVPIVASGQLSLTRISHVATLNE
jgi:hypothetical protein